MSYFDKLAAVLFEGDVVARDFKTASGTVTKTREQLAKALYGSMTRMGLIVDGKLKDEIKPKG